MKFPDEKEKLPPRDARRAQPENNARQRKTKASSNNKSKESIRQHKKKYFYRRTFTHNVDGRNQTCYVKPVLNVRYDAYYCPIHKVWLEERCDPTKECEICKGRPSVAKALEEK